MAVPESDALHIARWCRDRVPENLWDQVRVECEITDRHVTIVEVRPPWDGADVPWTLSPIARLRYTATTGLWILYWSDQNLRYHEYTRKRPTKNVQGLLDHIADSGDPVFWG